MSVLSEADGAIHTASPGDETSANLDSAVVDAAIEAIRRHRQALPPHQRRCGSTAITPRSARSRHSSRPPWWHGRSRSNAGSSTLQDMRGVVIVSSVAYGDGGGGIPTLLLNSPRDDDGNLIMLGTGRQHWSTIHVADLARFFRRVLESDSARGRYVVGDGLNPTVAELTEAAAVAAGAPGAVPGSDDEARARLGDYFAEVLLLDQGTSRGQGPGPARLVPDPSRTGRRVPPRELRA